MLPDPKTRLVPHCWGFQYRVFRLLQDIIEETQQGYTDGFLAHRIYSLLGANKDTVDAVMSIWLDDWKETESDK